MPDPHREPAHLTRRTVGRAIDAVRRVEDYDTANTNRTLPPNPRDQRGDRHMTPLKVTGSEDVTLTGLWPAIARYWTGYAGGTPVNFADQPGQAACWAFPAPGGDDLTNTGEYLGLFVGIHTDGKAVFEALPLGSGSGAALETVNSDATEQVLATAKITASMSDGLEFDESDPDTTLKGINAGLAQKGMVTTVNQPVKGYKLSHDDSTTTFTLGSSFGARGNGSTFTATADAGWFTVNETPWVGDSTVGSGLFGIMEDWEFTPIVGGCPANNLGSLFSTPALSVGAAYNTASGLLTAEFYLATTFTSGYPNVALDYNFAGFSLVTDGLNQTLYCGSFVFGPGFSGTRFGVIRGATGTFTAHDGIDQVVTFTVAGVVHTLTFIGGILTDYTAV